MPPPASDEPVAEQLFDQELGADGELREAETDFQKVRDLLYEEMLFFHPARRHSRTAEPVADELKTDEGKVCLHPFHTIPDPIPDLA